MIDLDLGLSSALMRAGRDGLRLLRENGITEEVISGDAARLSFNFITDHIREYGSSPSDDLLLMRTGVRLPEVLDPIAVYVDELKKRAQWNMLVPLSNDLSTLVNNRDVPGAHARLNLFRSDVRERNLGTNNVTSIWAEAESVLKDYQDAKEGRRGIRTPWPTMNEQTLGWSAGDLAIFVARTGVGKTWIMLLMAYQAWLDGHHVLFISPEMHRRRLAMRLFAIDGRYRYDQVRAGKLGDVIEPKFTEHVLGRMEEERFDVLGAGCSRQFESIEDVVDDTDPDILFLDGLYMFRGEGNNKRDQVAAVVEGCKEMAGAGDFPVVASTQFNRDVKRNDPDTADIGSVGITDAIGQNADVAYAAVQTEDMRTDREMLLRPMKIREGGDMQDITSRWCHTTMEFSELGRSDGFSDSDFDKYAVSDPTDTPRWDADQDESVTNDDSVPF